MHAGPGVSGRRRRRPVARRPVGPARIVFHSPFLDRDLRVAILAYICWLFWSRYQKRATVVGGMAVFLQKCFWYGSAVWLLRATGWRLAWAAVAVALLLGAIEVIQIHLLG